MLNNLFNSWRKPTEDDTVKIGDKLRYSGVKNLDRSDTVEVVGDVEFIGHRQIGIRVTACDHWGWDIGQIDTVCLYKYSSSIEVCR